MSLEKDFRHNRFRVIFLGDSTEPMKVVAGVEGFLELNPETGEFSFYDSSGSSSAPVVSYDGKAISNISADIRGMLRKRQFLIIDLEKGDSTITVEFQVLGVKANSVAAAVLSFRNEIESKPQDSNGILGNIEGLAQSLEKRIEEEVGKITASVQERLASVTQLGEKLKLQLSMDGDSKEASTAIDEFINAAEGSGIIEAVFGALMTKGMVSAANKDWRTSLKSLEKARKTALRGGMQEHVEEANRQIQRIKTFSNKKKEQIDSNDHRASSLETSRSEEVTMDEARHYLEGVEQILSESKDEPQ